MFCVNVALRNEGRALAQFVGVDFEFPRKLIEPRTELTGSVQSWEGGRPGLLIRHFNYRSRRDDPPIFPSEETVIWPNTERGGRIYFELSAETFSEFEDLDPQLRIIVYADSCPPHEEYISWRSFHDF